MDSNEIKQQIKSIMDTFGMTAVKAAEVMGIAYGQFRLKIRDVPNRNFTEDNLGDLIKYIVTEAEKLKVR